MPPVSQEWIDEHNNTDFPAPEADLTGKTAIVTGSNVGLGYEAVAHLMRMKASRIVMAVRTVSKGKAAREELLKRFEGKYEGTIDVWELDQASFASVKAFAAKVEKDLDRLDIAILNAGIATGQWRVTKDGWEETIQVNDIATGLLAVLLLPIMDKTAKIEGNSFVPHLNIVASEVHDYTKLPLRNEPTILKALNDKDKHDADDRYNISKLLDIFIMREVAQLAAARKVVVTASNPSLCFSELSRDLPDDAKNYLRSMSWPTEKGARNFAYAAVTDVPSGSYISECTVKEIGEFARSEEGQEAQKKIWEELKSIWIDLVPGIKTLLQS